MRVLAALVAALAMLLAPAAHAWADETDNFTCAARLTRDSLAALDALMNARIARAIDRANRKKACDAACLIRELQNDVGGSTPDRITWVPHSKCTAELRTTQLSLAFGREVGSRMNSLRQFGKPMWNTKVSLQRLP